MTKAIEVVAQLLKANIDDILRKASKRALEEVELQISVIIENHNDTTQLCQILELYTWNNDVKGFEDMSGLEDLILALENAVMEPINNKEVIEQTAQSDDRSIKYLPYIAMVSNDSTTHIVRSNCTLLRFKFSIMDSSSDLHTHYKMCGDLACQAAIIALDYFGDVISIEFDQITCAFYDLDDIHEEKSKQFPAFMRACVCGLSLRRLPSSVAREVSLSQGDLFLTVQQSREGLSSYLVHGPCFADMLYCNSNTATATTTPEAICVTKGYFQTIHDFTNEAVDVDKSASVDMTSAETNSADCYLISKLVLDLPNFSDMKRSINRPRLNNTAQITNETWKHLIPGPILACESMTNSVDGSCTESSQLRAVTVLCAYITNPVGAGECDAPEFMFETLTALLSTCGGYLKKFVQLSNGWLIQVIWGVPLSSFSNVGPRSLYCAIALREQAELLNWKCAAGIASGSALCGLQGCSERQDYVVTGCCLMEAAVLMQQAVGGKILLSQASQLLLTPTLQMQCIAKALNEGATEGVHFVWTGSLVPDAEMINDFLDSQYNFVFQSQITGAVMSQLNALAVIVGTPDGMPKIEPIFTAILGGPGTGKSSVLKYALQKGRKMGLQCLQVVCRAGEEAMPYGLIMKIFTEIIGPKHFDSEPKQRAIVERLKSELERVSGVSLSVKKCSMLKAFMGITWRDESVKSNSAASARATDSTRKTTTAKEATEKFAASCHPPQAAGGDSELTLSEMISVMVAKPMVIFIDDSHYCDELSWKLLHELQASHSPPLGIFFTNRIGTNGAPFSSTEMQNVRQHSSNSVGHSSHKVSNHNFAVIANAFHMSEGSSKGMSSHATANYSMNDDQDGGAFGKHSLERVQNSPYLIVLSHENCRLIELSLLSPSGVQGILVRLLGNDTGADNALVAAVHSFTSGNIYWVNTVSRYIKQHGVKSFLRAMGDHGHHPLSALSALVAAHTDSLPANVQLVGKYASVIGDYFTLEVLCVIVPEHVTNVWQHLEELRACNFIALSDEITATYSFQNSLIRTSLYDMMYPADTAKIHLVIAQYLAKKDSTDFSMLSYHYNRAGNRYTALKYIIKAAKRSLRNGAYADGYAFLQQALPLAVTRPELRALSIITRHAISLLVPRGGIEGLIQRVNGNITAAELNKMELHQKFRDFREDLEKTLAYMSTNPAKSAAGAASSESDHKHNSESHGDDEDKDGSIARELSCHDLTDKQVPSHFCVVS